MKRPIKWFLYCMFLFLALLPASSADAGPVEQSGDAPSGPDYQGIFAEDDTSFYVVRAYYPEPSLLAALAEYDEPWEINEAGGYVVLSVSRAEWMQLELIGYRIEIDEARTKLYGQPRGLFPDQRAGIPGFSCYRTVEETFASVDQLAFDYPDLVSVYDVGDSWVKVNSGGASGYDLLVLKLTDPAISGPKPKLFLLTGLHAREYAPPELALRFAEQLLAGHGINADATWILDSHEIHLMLHANPDGRKHAETGLTWRKNANDNYCTSNPSQRGADLNRNFDFEWNCCGGSSGDPCNNQYRGSSPASEPETQAVQTYLRSIFADNRGDLLTDAAPDSTPGIYIDIHSYGELVLWPWGFTATNAPNGTALQTLGRKFAGFNDYEPMQSVGLYPTDGASDDFAYGDLGMAGYTFEIGTEFFQSCTSFENTILPDNLDALWYAARAVRAPYQLAAGPDTFSPAVSSQLVQQGTPVTLTATIDDRQYSSNNGTEPTQNIAAAIYQVDTPYWVTTTTPISHTMQASDGSFNAKFEQVEAVIDTSALASGRHTIYVRGQDAQGNWGPVSAAFLYVFNPETAPVISGFVRQAGSNAPLGANVDFGNGLLMTETNPGTGYYEAQVVGGEFELSAASEGHSTETVSELTTEENETTTQDFDLSPSCVLWSDDVESGNVGWSAQFPWAITTETANSPTHSWTESPGGNYSNNRNTSLTSPAIDLSQASEVQLNFSHICNSEATFDFCNVEVSDNNGANWTTIASYDGLNTVWTDISLDANLLAGATNARVRFRFTSDVSVTEDGWHVDDIELVGSSPACDIDVPVQPAVAAGLLPGQMQLNWSHDPANESYEVHRSTLPYFIPDGDTLVTTILPPTATYTDTTGIGNPAANYFYTIRAKAAGSSLVWDGVSQGEFDFGLLPGD